MRGKVGASILGALLGPGLTLKGVELLVDGSWPGLLLVLYGAALSVAWLDGARLEWRRRRKR